MYSKGLRLLIIPILLLSISLAAKTTNVQGQEYQQQQLLLEKIYTAKDDKDRVAIFEVNKDKLNQEFLSALLTTADEQRLSGDLKKSFSIFSFVNIVSDRLQYAAGKSEALRGLGRLRAIHAEYDQAMILYQQAFSVSDSGHDLAGKAESLRLIAGIQDLHGQSDDATKSYQESLVIEESIQNKAGIAKSIYWIGARYIDEGMEEIGFEYLNKSLNLAHDAGDLITEAAAWNSLGVYYDYGGNYDRALDYYERAATLNRQRGNPYGLGNNLHNIGTLLYTKGNYVEALQYHLESLKLRSMNKRSSAISLKEIASLYADQGQYETALQYLNRSYNDLTVSNDPIWASSVLSDIGKVYSLMGKPEKAISYFKKALPQSEKFGEAEDIASTLRFMGEAYVSEKQFDQARECYRNALHAVERAPRIDTKTRILEASGWLEYATHNYNESLRVANEAIDLSQKHELNEVLWSALLCKAKNSSALQKPKEAQAALTESIQVLEGLREHAGGEEDRERYLERRTEPYAAMIDLLIEQKQKEEALNYAERAKARVLLDVMQKGRTNINQAMTDEEKAEETRLKENIYRLNSEFHDSVSTDTSKLNALKTKLDKARMEHNAFQTGLYAKHPELRIQRGETEIANLQMAQSLLKNHDTAFLEYVVAKNKTFLFLVTNSEMKIYVTDVSEQRLTQIVSAFRNQISKRDPNFRNNAKQLYQLLLGPAEPVLNKINNAIIIPDSILWDLPFQALLNANDQFFLENRAVSYAVSITALGEMEKLKLKRSSAPTVLAFANPSLGKETADKVQMVFRGIQLLPLKEAEVEVEKLPELYGSDHTSIYVGANATESVLKDKIAKYNVIHLATHGIVNETNPMYSHLLFSRSDKSDQEDGLLEAWEIMNMNLHANLVVLSACETARGRISKGEGMIGLNWAFFIAGCPTTVVSQWKVESSSTAEFMYRFHQNLQKPEIARSQALREAAFSLLKNPDYRHPFYWASFIIVGDPS